MYAGGGRTVVGIWKVTELATEGRSLEKLSAMLGRLDIMSPVSEEVWRCMVGEGAIAGSLARRSLNMGAAEPNGGDDDDVQLSAPAGSRTARLRGALQREA